MFERVQGASSGWMWQEENGTIWPGKGFPGPSNRGRTSVILPNLIGASKLFSEKLEGPILPENTIELILLKLLHFGHCVMEE